VLVITALVCTALLASACRQAMFDQPRLKPQGASDFFADGRAGRPAIPGTVARGHLRDDAHLYTGKVNGQLVTTFPFPISRADLLRGQERFNIFCAPCHDAIGNGTGMIVRRGMRQPPSFHIDRLRDAPAGHFFDVITNGLGAMQDYSAQISPEDRWRIVAFIRALQLSQRAAPADVPPTEMQRLREAKRP
jgi:cytochrome c553